MLATVDPMADSLRVRLPLEARGPAGAFVITDEQVATLGAGRKTFPVTVAVHGARLPLRLARMGGENLIGLAKAARAQAGVEIGMTYDVEITAEVGEREVEVPADLAAALAADPVAEERFTGLAYSHRKSFAQWVVEAKRDQTRADRVAKTVEMVREGRTR